MLTKSKIGLSFAVVLGAASATAATHAFAGNACLDWACYATSSQNGKGESKQMNRHPMANAARGEHPRQPDAPLRWIDNPASPGG
jgi:hypothetical protein